MLGKNHIMKYLPTALVLALFATGAAAQTTPSTSPTKGNSMAPAGTAMTPSANGPSAAGGNDNQAVATTNANAMQPAHGANSFSMREARRRIAKHGFTQVADLRKDENGVWRGTAMMQGSKANVWLDYKGNVGQQ